MRYDSAEINRRLGLAGMLFEKSLPAGLVDEAEEIAV